MSDHFPSDMIEVELLIFSTNFVKKHIKMKMRGKECFIADLDNLYFLKDSLAKMIDGGTNYSDYRAYKSDFSVNFLTPKTSLVLLQRTKKIRISLSTLR